MILSQFYEVGDMLVAVVLDQEYNGPKVIRVVEIPDMNLTPEFFINARRGFPNYKPYYHGCTKDLTWNYLERYRVLVASINNRGGFQVFDDCLMKKRARSMFGKKAIKEYARSFPTKATDCGLSP